MSNMSTTRLDDMCTKRFTITRVRSAKDLTDTIALFEAYAKSLNLDLSFQDFATEMAEMPGKYTPSEGGELLIARRSSIGLNAPQPSPSTSHVSPDSIRSIETGVSEEKTGEGDGEAIGCAALRHFSTSKSTSSLPSSPITQGRAGTVSTVEVESAENTNRDYRVAEFKRLYVTPDARGTGAGRALSEAIVRIAEDQGYDEIRLDTLPSMVAAQKMYSALGFEEIDPYRHNPVTGAKFLGLRLPRAVNMDGAWS